MGPLGKVRNPWVVIGLSIVTLGIYSLYWQYATFRSLREHSGRGIGGAWGLVFALLLGIVNVFVMPAEVGNLYATRGQPEPVTVLTGFWILLPIVGGIIWVVRVQGTLNRYWEAATPVAA